MTPAIVREVQRRKLKAVSLGGPTWPGPWHAAISQESICRLALDHFWQRGLRRFAFCYDTHGARRGELFTALAAEKGAPVHTFKFSPELTPAHLRREANRIGEMLCRLQRPIGVLAEDDSCARKVIDCCRLAGLAVPEDVAVLGIDNDDTMCELSRPSLSSVALNSERLGYESAAALDAIFRGTPPESCVMIEPLGVVVRQSTDLIAIADADLAAAMQYIRQHHRQPVQVDEVVAAACMSRRALEIRFRREVGRSIVAELRRVRLETAMQLLRDTDYKIERISEASGFSSAFYFCQVFRKFIGSSPTEYRDSTRRGGR
jgi:LacI family transcriptional regulator